MADWTLYLAATTCIWTAYKVFEWWMKCRRISSLPTISTLFSSNSVLGNIFPPTVRNITRGGLYPFFSKHADFAEQGWNVVANTSPLPTAENVVLVADAAIVKEVTANRSKSIKPLEIYGALALYGKNVVVTEGDEWKMHRKISQPAFSEQNNRLVWKSSVELVNELIDDVWTEKDEVVIPQVLELTIKMALMVLGIAGFGKRMTWKMNEERPKGYKMTFPEALYVVSSRMILKLLFPNYVLRTVPKLKEVSTAFDTLGKYMDDLIEQGKNGGQEKRRGKWDLLTNLIAAGEEGADGDKTSQLTFDELRGNTFVYLVAGHETTTHTLAYSFGLLALHPEEQDKLYAHIKEVLGDRQPTYDDAPALSRVLAVFNETLRLFPPVILIPKKVTEDTIFDVTSADPASLETRRILVPSDTPLFIHTPGLHYNPRYWENPLEFNPDRFLKAWNKDAFAPFSAGARSCIGRKFAETEGVAILTSLVSQYTVHISPEKEVEYAGLTSLEKRDKLLASYSALTLTPIQVPLVFRKRK